MRLGIGYLTSNRHTAYPFEDGAAGLGDAGVGQFPDGALVDACFTVSDSIPVCLEVVGKSSGTAVLLFSTPSSVSLASVVISAFPDIGSGYSVIGVDGGSSGDPALMGVYGRILVSADFYSYLDSLPDGDVNFSDTLRFSTATTTVRPGRVFSVEGKNNAWFSESSLMGSGALQGDVKLVAGYNMSLTTNDDGEIEFVAAAGAGAGTVPCDDSSITDDGPEPPQQLQPDVLGRIKIVGDDCYTIVPGGTGAGTLQIQGSCYACCDCEDFTAFGESLRGLLTRGGALYTGLDAIHRGPLAGAPNLWGYEDAVTYWNSLDCDAGCGTGVDLVGSGLKGYKGASKYGTLSLRITNNECEAVNLKLKITDSATVPVPCARDAGGWRTMRNNVTNVPWTTGPYEADWEDISALPKGASVGYTWELGPSYSMPAYFLVFLTYKLASDPVTWYTIDSYPISVGML